MSQVVLGIDIGGTKLAMAVAAPGGSGEIMVRRRRPIEPTSDGLKDLKRISDDARAMLSEAGAAARDLVAVGVSVPGPFDAETGAALDLPNLPGWDGVPLRHVLAREFEVPVRVENDANAAALAEWRFGAGRGASDLVYLTMSTGVGAGLILSGKLYRGQGGFAGEVGHAPVGNDDEGGALCGCGLRGCLEAYVGGASWTRHLREVADPAGALARLAEGAERIRPEHVVEAAKAGDAEALAHFDRFNTYLARGIVQVAFTLAPEVVVLGTIPTAAGAALCLEPVRERVRAALWRPIADNLRIVPAALGEELPFLAGVGVALEPA